MVPDSHHCIRDQFKYGPSQWEMLLQCNDISHWLGAYLDWSLLHVQTVTIPCCAQHSWHQCNHGDIFNVSPPALCLWSPLDEWAAVNLIICWHAIYYGMTSTKWFPIYLFISALLWKIYIKMCSICALFHLIILFIWTHMYPCILPLRYGWNISIANALDILQSCIQSWICFSLVLATVLWQW